MNGKTVLVTGASSGIGQAAARAFAARGAAVVMVCRDALRGDAARQEIIRATGSSAVEVMLCDLSSQRQIRELADAIKARHGRLNILVNNAAVFKSRREVTEDGLEMMFAINHLAYFLLTNLLLDVLRASAPASVINVTAPATNELKFDDLQGERRFSAFDAFGASKTCNLLFTFALARRLQGSGVTANACHPGIVRTRLMRDAPLPIRVASSVFNLVAGSATRAGEDLVNLADGAARETTGQLFHGGSIIEAPAYARDEQVQDHLWNASRELVGLNR